MPPNDPNSETRGRGIPHGNCSCRHLNIMPTELITVRMESKHHAMFTAWRDILLPHVDRLQV